MAREPLSLLGVSVAGVETSIEVPSLHLVLDMGRCSSTAVNQRVVLVSHGHLDHAGALPQHAARRAMLKMEAGIYVVPKPIGDAVERLFNAAGAIDGNPIPRRIVPLEPGAEFPLSGTRVVRPFETLHRVPSQGYVVWERRHRLRPEFRGREGGALSELRKQGVELEESYETPLLAFSGDTRVDVLEREPALYRADTLVLEASFLDQRVSVEEARRMGHVHLDEIVQRRGSFQNRELVLSHFSARYTKAEIGDYTAALRDGLHPQLRAFGAEP